MKYKSKNLLITFLSVFLCLMAVMTSLWTTPIKVSAEEEYVWVDLRVGDTIANKKLRFHGNGDLNNVKPSEIIVLLEGGLKFRHDTFEPIYLTYIGSEPLMFDIPTAGLDSFIPNERVEDDPEGNEWGGIYEYSIPSSLPCNRLVSEEIPGEQVELWEPFNYSLEGLKVSDISIVNSEYGVKVQVLMDKEEAVASGRYKITNDYTLWGITVPVFSVGIVAIICLFAVRKRNQVKRSKVYRGN